MSNNSPTTAAVDKTAAVVFRYAAGVEYSGTNYHGYQTQHNQLPTIQVELEQAFSRVAGGAGIAVNGAGRTDAQVHACEQVVHFDSPVARPERAWLYGANSHLPKDISVLWVKQVADNFDARFSAMRRRYRYVFYSADVRPALLRHELTWTYKQLDVDKMHHGAQALVGKHDFSSFRASECQAKTAIKTIDAIAVTRFGRYVVLDVRADGFLHHMVRNIAGTLLMVGSGERSVDWVADVLVARERAVAGITAPAAGLYMLRVEYAPEFALPQIDLGPHFLATMPDPFEENHANQS